MAPSKSGRVIRIVSGRVDAPQKYIAKLRRFLKQLELVDRLRHDNFSKLSTGSNCFEKLCGSANIIVDEWSVLF